MCKTKPFPPKSVLNRSLQLIKCQLHPVICSGQNLGVTLNSIPIHPISKPSGNTMCSTFKSISRILSLVSTFVVTAPGLSHHHLSPDDFHRLPAHLLASTMAPFCLIFTKQQNNSLKRKLGHVTHSSAQFLPGGSPS